MDLLGGLIIGRHQNADLDAGKRWCSCSSESESVCTSEVTIQKLPNELVYDQCVPVCEGAGSWWPPGSYMLHLNAAQMFLLPQPDLL